MIRLYFTKRPPRHFRNILFAATVFALAQTTGLAHAEANGPAEAESGKVDEQTLPLSEFRVFRGNSHGHTIFTWSHGIHRRGMNGPFHDHWERPPGFDPDDHTSVSLDPDDHTHLQGLPANHFALAKKHGYDFYVTTDHSQEVTLQPPVPDNPFWVNTLEAAAAYDDDPDFVAMVGVEYSRNTEEDGGRGHINVFNVSEYVNADHRPGTPPWPEANWTIPQFYDWLKSAEPPGKGLVVAQFNHPELEQYNDWDHLDDEIVDLITLFELHTNFRNFRWRPYLRALNKGWKVSPVGVHDNHNLQQIEDAELPPPTLVVATALTREAITRAMRERRTFVTWHEGTELIYSVNGHIMGSTLDSPETFDFDIRIKTEPDHPERRVRRIQILRDHPNGEDAVEVAAEKEFSGDADEISWTPTIEDATARYFLVRVDHQADLRDDGDYRWRGFTYSGPVWTGRTKAEE